MAKTEAVDRTPIEADKSLLNPNEDPNSEENMSRRQAAVKLKVYGASYADIAKELHYASPASARRAIERAMAEADVAETDRERVRHLLNMRLERLSASVSPRAFNAASKDHLDYVGAMLRIMDRQMALYGLSSSNVTITPAPERVAAVVAQLTELTAHAHDQEADIIDAEIMPEDEDG